MPVPEIQPGERGYLRPEDMHFDVENPRFAAYDRERLSDSDVINSFMLHEDLMELLESIAANGFMKFEPLLVLHRSDHYVVLEGNRRLAAVKLLLDPGLAQELNVTLPYIAESAKTSLAQIEVQAVATREEARQFIGFKHVNGPHKWDSFAKGKFAADWYRQEKDRGVTLRDIARRLGDRHDTIKRLVQGIYVIEQAERHGLFRLDDRFGNRPFAFSHLYTALTRSGYRAYLGLPEEWRDLDPLPDPVPAENHDKLRQVLSWLYGSKADDAPPVVTSQNPHVKQLGEVLEHGMATRRLEVERSLPLAVAEVVTPSRKFSEAMLKALQAAETAQQNVYDFDQEDRTLVQIAERLAKVANSIWDQVRRNVKE